MPSPTITIRDVRTFLIASGGNRLVVVRVETSEPGLYGLGCATFTQRHLAVRSAVEDFLKPFVVGKDVQRIEDIWQTAYQNSYWRNGPVTSNALSGVDMALWDIKGKLAGLPLYQLLGGKCREAAAVYRHANGRDAAEVVENARAWQEQGYHYIRCQLGGYGGYAPTRRSPEGALPGAYFDPDAYARSIPPLFERLRADLGFDVELLHDIHERLAPIEAVRLAKGLDPYRLFFLEDPLPPEQNAWFSTLRAQRHADRHGRTVHQPQRVAAADRQPADRLHPLPRQRHRRHHPGAQAGRAVRVLRGAYGLAWSGRYLSDRPRGQPAPGPGLP